MRRALYSLGLGLGLGVVSAFGFSQPASAEVVGEAVTYEVGGKAFEGYFARNTRLGDNQPVVLIIHDWDGLNDYEKRRADMLAALGYAAFAADLYGKGVRPTSIDENKQLSGALYKDRKAMRDRLFGAMEAIKGLQGVDGGNVVAAGYCFGGAAVLEMARAGAETKGFITLHGGLSTPKGQDYSQVKAPVLVLHGSADSAVPMSQVASLADGLNKAGVEHEMEIYGGAPHAFTVWDSNRYRKNADLSSWAAMMTFLERRLR